MKHKDQEKYNLNQREEIEKFKWIESEKAGKDIYEGKEGRNKAAFDWIKKYAEDFKKFWSKKG